MGKRATLTFAAVLMLSAAAAGDGKYWPEPAYPATPKIPLQRAIIVHRDGLETLIVESAFESESPNVGWVLPLPAEPTKLAVANPGMLKSLSMCLRPRILHDLTPLWMLVLVVALGTLPITLSIILRTNRKKRNTEIKQALFLYLILILMWGFFLGHLGSAGSGPGGSPIEVKSFQRVGNYDVSVLRAKDAGALSKWLEDNGFEPLDARSVAVVDDYVSREWCFVVARLMRDAGGTGNPHPISATFPAERPLYPMKLTGLADSTTRVELFVIADETACADRFRRVASDMFGRIQEGWKRNVAPYYHALETDLTIGSPDVGELMWGGCVVTSLRADLTPEQMDRDVKIYLAEMKPHREVVFSARGRRELTIVVLLCGCIVLLIASAAIFRGRRRPGSGEAKVLITLVFLILVAVLVAYATVRAIPVQGGVGWWSFWSHASDLRRISEQIAKAGKFHGGMSDAELSELPDMLRDLAEEGFPIRREMLDNPLTGERMRFERTPGNFSVRRIEGEIYLCFYDADCREYRVALPPPGTKPSQ